MKVEENKSLKHLNTFGFDYCAEFYCETSSAEDLCESLAFAKEKALPIFLLGAGSNIVLVRNIPGLTIRQCNSQIEFAETTVGTTVVSDAGVNWHQLVTATLDKNFGGLENLSLIPGNAGAAPIQNIGAYGVELCDVLVQLTAMNLEDGEIVQFSHSDCRFGYRDSIFKQSLKNQFAILSIELRVNDGRQPYQQMGVGYQALADAMDKRNLVNPGPREISRVVCEIRQSKLPDPSVIGNAGSFFKNPVISGHEYRKLRSRWEHIPGYQQADGDYKLPAAWLIESAGLKGKRFGRVGVHTEQALVLVHYGGGTGPDLLGLAERVSRSVHDKFGLELEREPTVI